MKTHCVGLVRNEMKPVLQTMKEFAPDKWFHDML